MTVRFTAPERLLTGHGPSNVAPEVLAAGAQLTTGHLDADFQRMIEEVQGLLRCAFKTANAVTFPISAPASLAMEAGVVNVLEAGDTAIIAQNGVFGGRMADIAERAGATCVSVETDQGKSGEPGPRARRTRRASRSEASRLRPCRDLDRGGIRCRGAGGDGVRGRDARPDGHRHGAGRRAGDGRRVGRRSDLFGHTEMPVGAAGAGALHCLTAGDGPCAGKQEQSTKLVHRSLSGAWFLGRAGGAVVGDVATRATLLGEFGIEIGAGLGPFAGHVWRVGLMGETARDENVDRLMDALSRVLGRNLKAAE